MLDGNREAHPFIPEDYRRAVAFYRREGFRVWEEGIDPETGAAEYTMGWTAEEL